MSRSHIRKVERQIMHWKARVVGTAHRKRGDHETVNKYVVFVAFSLQDQDRFIWVLCSRIGDYSVGNLSRNCDIFSGHRLGHH